MGPFPSYEAIDKDEVHDVVPPASSDIDPLAVPVATDNEITRNQEAVQKGTKCVSPWFLQPLSQYKTHAARYA